MRNPALVASLLALAVAFASAPAAAVKKVPYPEVKVEAPAPFQGDATFEAMQKALFEAIEKKNLAALSALVEPGFQWLAAGDISFLFDPVRDGLHNFKVALGFRPHGKDADGPTDGGPQWDLLAFLANADSLAALPQSNVICGPAAVTVIDEQAFDRALQAVDEPTVPSEWVYVIDEVTLTASPTGGAEAGKAAKIAMPVVAMHPAAPAEPTHVELLLPTGKTGWVALDTVDFLNVARLCYEKNEKGEWKIVAFHQTD